MPDTKPSNVVKQFFEYLGAGNMDGIDEDTRRLHRAERSDHRLGDHHRRQEVIDLPPLHEGRDDR